jgi:hypothetical protein
MRARFGRIQCIPGLTSRTQTDVNGAANFGGGRHFYSRREFGETFASKASCGSEQGRSDQACEGHFFHIHTSLGKNLKFMLLSSKIEWL